MRQATSIYLGRITNDALDETTRFGTFLDPVFGSSDRWGDIVDFGLDKGSIGMDTLSVTFKVVESRESSATIAVRADVRLGSKRVVRLNMGLQISTGQRTLNKMTYLQVECTGKASTTNTTSVSLFGIVRSLTGNIATSTTVEVGEGNVGWELRFDIVFGKDGSSVEFVLAFTRCDARHGDGGRGSHRRSHGYSHEGRRCSRNRDGSDRRSRSRLPRPRVVLSRQEEWSGSHVERCLSSLMSLHMGLSLHLVIDRWDRCGSRLPHVDRCIGGLLLLHHGWLERDDIVDAFVDIDRVGETIRRRVGVDIDIVVHRHVVHFQLFTHQTCLFFGLNGKSLIMQEPL